MENLPTRNQNPGDLRDPSTGAFRKFATPQEGHAALLNDLTAKMTGTSTTGIGPSSSIADFSKVYAPPGDNNNSAQYAANLSNKLGVSPDTKIGSLRGRIGDFANAISGNEGYQGGFNPTPFSHPDSGSALGKVVTPETASPAQPQEQSLAQKLAGRSGDISKIWSEHKVNPLSAGLQTVGGLAGGITDVAQSTAENLPFGIGGAVKGVEGLIGQGVGALANTGIGKSVIGVGQNFAQAHPEVAGDIGAVGNIAGAYGLMSGAGALKDAVGEGIAKVAGKDALSSIIEDISPAETKKTLARSIAKGGTEQSGLLGTISTTENPAIREAAQVVQENVPGFSEMKTFAEKINAAKKSIGNLAQTLRTNLTGGDVIPLITQDDWSGYMDAVKTSLAENPMIVGDAEKTAEKILNRFQSYLPKGDIQPVDILDARQKLDQWIGQLKGPTVFDPARENAVSTALRAVRQGANDLLESKVPNAGVKNLLRQQTLLFDAVDNMAPNAAKEVGTTNVGRFIGRHPVIKGVLKGVKTGAKAAAIGSLGGTGYEVAKGLFEK